MRHKTKESKKVIQNEIELIKLGYKVLQSETEWHWFYTSIRFDGTYISNPIVFGNVGKCYIVLGNEQYSTKTPISNIRGERGIIEAKVEGGRVLEATLHVGRSEVSLNVSIKQENSTRIDDASKQEIASDDNTDSKFEQESNTRISDAPIQEITPDDSTLRKSEQESNTRAGGASKQGVTPDENNDRIYDPVQDYLINRITYLEKILPSSLGRETLKVLNLDHDVMICDMRAGRLNITVFTRNENTADNVRHYNRKEDIPDNTKIDMLLYSGCDEGTIETLTAFLRKTNPKLLSFDMSKVANHS